MRPPLPSEIFARYDTDKDIGVPKGHNYCKNFYNHYLTHYRWAEAVLELGIYKGESLRALREYHPDARIVGADIDAKTLIWEDRIHSVKLDCSDDHQLKMFSLSHYNQFSVIIDDASHVVEHQLKSFHHLKKTLRLGGMYCIEDIMYSSDIPLFQKLGMVVLEWDTDLRSDNRIAYYIKEEY